MGKHTLLYMYGLYCNNGKHWLKEF